MKKTGLTICFLLLYFSMPASPSPAAEQATLQQIRHFAHPDHTRVVLDLDRPTSYKVVRNDGAIKISLPDALPSDVLSESRSILSDTVIETLEISVKEKGKVRLEIVITPRHHNRYKTFTLDQPDRIVIDIFASPKAVPTPSPPPKPPLTIVIDPGHGGKDPGAIGVTGMTEKEVVMDVGLRLKSLLRKRLKSRVILTRDTDRFLTLGERARLANRRGADLFVSIHANASPDPDLRGVEIFLFGKTTNPEALVLAARENAGDDKTARDFQEMILSDMKRDFLMNASLTLAHSTYDAFSKGPVLQYKTVALGVKRAPFYVLAKTEMPAILAEISFLSHAEEEGLLKKKSYRSEIAEALFAGISAYIASSGAP
jgi:N-acetylmuramoyl-L-alanine amidase